MITGSSGSDLDVIVNQVMKHLEGVTKEEFDESKVRDIVQREYKSILKFATSVVLTQSLFFIGVLIYIVSIPANKRSEKMKKEKQD